jgi:hypothetical protein
MNAPATNISGSVKSVCNNLACEAIIECCDLAASYARSAGEAAWRGDRRLLSGHLAQLRLTVIAALDAHKHLGPLPEIGVNG